MTFYYQDREYYSEKDLALSIIGGKWKLGIVWELLQQSPLRLSELQRKIPNINQRMLIRQLRELEEDHIIDRIVYPVVPPKVEYELTDIGRSLKPTVDAICDWGYLYIDKSPEVTDATKLSD